MTIIEKLDKVLEKMMKHSQKLLSEEEMKEIFGEYFFPLAINDDWYGNYMFFEENERMYQVSYSILNGRFDLKILKDRTTNNLLLYKKVTKDDLRRIKQIVEENKKVAIRHSEIVNYHEKVLNHKSFQLKKELL